MLGDRKGERAHNAAAHADTVGASHQAKHKRR